MDILIKKLKSKIPITSDDSFRLAKYVSLCFSQKKSDIVIEGRNIIILILDNWNNIPKESVGIWVELIESAGFYPYLNQLNLTINCLDNKIRRSYHQSNYIDGKILHSEQKQLSELILSGKNVIVSAPTSFGKSLLIEEIVAGCKYKNIVIIQPTLALLDETRNKLKKYESLYKIIVRTSQQFSLQKGNIFLLTAERVLEYQNMPPIDLLILDEFYKLSNRRHDNRSNILNNAFIKLTKNSKCQFYLLGPNIDGVSQGFTEKYNAIFYKTNYSMVLTESDDRYNCVKTRTGGKIINEDIFSVLDEMNDQTLIYCSSPSTARKLAFEYQDYLVSKNEDIKNSVPLIDWLDHNLSHSWSLTKCLAYGIGIHDGSMPKHITSSTINYFNSKKLKYLFCTNTIIEGVNTSAKNVIYYDNKIGGSRKIDFFDYANIRGRAGRLMEHYVGRIINLRKPPDKENIIVDLPFIEQNPIDKEVLINLQPSDIKDINDNRNVYNEFHSLDAELQDILKRNSVTIDGQLQILSQLQIDLNDKRNLIVWNTIDKNIYNRLTYIFGLCWDVLPDACERRYLGNQKWVINKIVSSCFKTSIGEIIDNDIQFGCAKLAENNEVEFISVNAIKLKYPKEVQNIIDKTIEKVFGLQKNWLQYRAPKWLNVVNSLQKYVCEKEGIIAGDYSYVAEMIENNFIEPTLRILLEYGLPLSAVEKIQEILCKEIKLSYLAEDDIFDIIKNQIGFYKSKLSEYEFEILDRIL